MEESVSWFTEAGVAGLRVRTESSEPGRHDNMVIRLTICFREASPRGFEWSTKRNDPK